MGEGLDHAVRHWRETMTKHGAVLLLSVGLVWGEVSAQGAPTSAEPAPASRLEVQRRLRLLRAWEITRALKLDGETAGKLLAVFSKSDEKRQALVKELRDSRREITKLQRKKQPDVAALQTQIDQHFKARLALAQLAHDEFTELRAILSPVQQAKFLQAERRFQKRIQQILRQIRKR
jgi:Spy/CpxP family protein refolding chaperone